MKKIFAFAIMMIAALSLFAQKDSVANAIADKSAAIGQSGNNEIKINLLMSVLALPEVTYERLVEDNMGVGISVAVNVDNTNDAFDGDFKLLIIPHYRLYFGSKKASGFFIEGNAALVSGSVYTIYYDPAASYVPGYIPYQKENTTNFGLGAAVGGKFLTRNGFLGEVYGGVGRLFGSNRIADVYPRIGISIGKRF